MNKRTKKLLGSIFRYLAATVTVAVGFYVLLALFFSTEEEKKLQQENDLYTAYYPELREKERLLTDVVRGLEVKDDALYRQIFQTEAPSVDALTAADIGVAIGAGTDVAIDAADIVLAKNSLAGVATAIRLSRAALRNIKQNLFWAFFYNALGIPLAAGAWIWLLGWKLNPMFGAAAMSLSSFCVVTNALRLNFFRASNNAGKAKAAGKEKNMKKTIKIEGLMCSHCDARVKKALEAVPGVASANADHEKGQAVVELSADVADDALKAAVEAQDYKVLGID